VNVINRRGVEQFVALAFAGERQEDASLVLLHFLEPLARLNLGRSSPAPHFFVPARHSLSRLSSTATSMCSPCCTTCTRSKERACAIC
jgi:hypothetical protein